MQKHLIIYIHGWASSSHALKAKILQNHFQSVFAPTLPVNCDLAINLLENSLILLNPHYRIILVGSSLGGFYSVYLANKFGLKAVLINPVIDPCKELERAIGKHENFDGSFYTFNEEMLRLYKKYRLSAIENKQNYLILLQKGDELLDYREAKHFFKGGNVVVEEGGSHSYENLEGKIPLIRSFGLNFKL